MFCLPTAPSGGLYGEHSGQTMLSSGNNETDKLALLSQCYYKRPGLFLLNCFIFYKIKLLFTIMDKKCWPIENSNKLNAISNTWMKVCYSNNNNNKSFNIKKVVITMKDVNQTESNRDFWTLIYVCDWGVCVTIPCVKTWDRSNSGSFEEAGEGPEH